ncbi:MAG: arginine transporter [Pseudomonadota bacterium]
MRAIIALTCIVALAACGGRSGSTRGATGDISRACLAADRSAASVQLCTCIQGVANAELSSRDRSRVASFFANPEVAHATKISDTRANDAFWERYQGFVRRARNTCG